MSKKILDNLVQVAQAIPVPICWLDKESIVLGANEPLLKALGIASYKDLIGKSPYDLYPKEMAEPIKYNEEEVVRSGKIISQEDRVVDVATGKVKYFLATRAPLRDDNGEIIGIVVTAIETTAQKEAEELRLNNSIITEKIETMRVLAASIAHEIRPPLAGINAQSMIIKTVLPTLLEAYQFAESHAGLPHPLSAPQLDFFKNLPDELNRTIASANTFIDMLLAKVNLESMQEQGKTKPLSRLSAREVVQEAIHLYPMDSHTAELIHVDYSQDFYFMGDEILFRHIIFNLLKNAIYFVLSKGQNGKIAIWLEKGEKYNQIHFKDTGTGIKPEDLPDIFNSFFSKTRHGTGVGLAFCKTIIENFGGQIHCDSQFGEYTHFSLYLPTTHIDK